MATDSRLQIRRVKNGWVVDECAQNYYSIGDEHVFTTAEDLADFVLQYGRGQEVSSSDVAAGGLQDKMLKQALGTSGYAT